MVVFLLSARASYINGAEIPVDGGHTSHGGAKADHGRPRQGSRHRVTAALPATIPGDVTRHPGGGEITKSDGSHSHGRAGPG